MIELAVWTGIPMDDWVRAGNRAIITGLHVIEQGQKAAQAELTELDDDPDDRVMSG